MDKKIAGSNKGNRKIKQGNKIETRRHLLQRRKKDKDLAPRKIQEQVSHTGGEKNGWCRDRTAGYGLAGQRCRKKARVATAGDLTWRAPRSQ